MHRPAIVAVCEVKSKRKVVKNIEEYNISGYTLRHANLDKEYGRGIAVYTMKDLDASILQIECKVDEIVQIDIKLKGGDCLSFSCIYRSPTKTENSEKTFAEINNFISNIARSDKYSHRCIVGDFNFKAINWRLWSSSKDESSQEEKFLCILNDSFLHQHVREATRWRGSDEPSVLDLVLTDEATQVSEICYDSPLGKSDHSVLVFDFKCYTDRQKQPKTFNYPKGDYKSMIKEIEDSNWVNRVNEMALSCTPNELWLEFKKKLQYLRNKFVPAVNKTGTHWSSKGSVPLDEKTRDLLRKKNKLFKQWVRASSEGNEKELARLSFVRTRNKVKNVVRSAKRSFEKQIAQNSKWNAKPFWAYTRRKMKTTTGVSPLLADVTDPDSLKFTAFEQAAILQKQFLSVFTDEPDGELPTMSEPTAKITDLSVTVDCVKKLLEKINHNKSVGPDDLHPMLLKELSCCLSEPVAILFNLTLKFGSIPDDWKTGNIIPIYKKGSRKIAENYRPISLTSVLCKIMEKIVRTHLMKHLIDNKLLSPKQFGFISGRSTTTQLLYFIDICIDLISEGFVVDAIYFDFAKAFDSVPHKRLLHKLASFGITGNTFDWIKSFLTGRKQYVTVNGVSSDSANVLSGVPQGTVLGPILFVMYINDLLDDIKAGGLLYADDTKIFSCIKEKNDAFHLQTDIDTLERWTNMWLMKFHPKKCHVLTLGKFTDIRYAHEYKVCNNVIEHVSFEKDLGIVIDEELTFEEHICTKVRIANALVGQIRRTFSYLDGETLKKLFTSLVRPHLEYGQSVWSPFLMRHIDLIERVQERATKLVDGMADLDYSQRLKKLGLTTLRFRRLRGDLIEMHKHFHLHDKDAITGPSFQTRDRPSRRHNHQVLEPARTRERGIRENSFYGRTSRIWNALPRNVAESKTVNSFKNALDKYFEAHPLKYNHKDTHVQLM